MSACARRASRGGDRRRWLPGLDDSISRMPRPELEVVARHGDQFVTARGVIIRCIACITAIAVIVEILAPDERRELGEEAIAERPGRRRRPAAP